MGDQLEAKRIIAIIQARMSASRLPGKVLLDIGAESMLDRVVQRTRRSQIIDQVVVATSEDGSDDPVAQHCAAQGYDCYRGSLHDVLDRYYQAAKHYSAGEIVRITADCPIIDPIVVDQTLRAFHGQGSSTVINGEQKIEKGPQLAHAELPAWDFAANRLPPPWRRTFPIGLDTEVCSFNALDAAWRDAKKPYQREHVMPYLYDNVDRFRILLVNHDPDYGKYRLTVDTKEDLSVIRAIYARFGGKDDFSWLDVLELLREQPDLMEINAGILHKDYRQVDKHSEQ
ncbi:MAG: glycosyltransferase family protein [Chloroflexota bacterium]|nr:MAG: glycosyltransferase family protein [Chloroflexota bacterium]